MTDKKVWFITGAGRGLGVDIAKAALAAGNTVVATGRSTDAVSKAIGQAEGFLVVKLDITNPADAEAAVTAAVDRFERIDVLVNNAANFIAGYFEELTPQQIERQLATSLIGPMKESTMQKRTLAAGQYRPVINRIFHDVTHPSRLILPIIER